MKYSIWNPTGNITALVESETDIAQQPSAAAELMSRHAQVEQVGFVQFKKEDIQVQLRMAGGEFCGNAAMSAASLYLMRSNQPAKTPASVRVRVSGATSPLQVTLVQKDRNVFSAALQTPWNASVNTRHFCFNEQTGELPVVDMGGIVHLIIETDSVFFNLLNDRQSAERAVRQWCGELSAPCLGLMFLKNEEDFCDLQPLVYVPGSQTVFWENSCASGSTAVCIFDAVRRGKGISLDLRQPGGLLSVRCDGPGEDIILQGSTSLVQFG